MDREAWNENAFAGEPVLTAEEILAEYWAEEAATAGRTGAAADTRVSEALSPSEAEDDVRIYEPGRRRARSAAGSEPALPRSEKPRSEKPRSEQLRSEKPRKAKGPDPGEHLRALGGSLESGLQELGQGVKRTLSGLRREKAVPPARERRVREERPARSRKAERPREPVPEREELSAGELSLDQILAEYYGEQTPTADPPPERIVPRKPAGSERKDPPPPPPARETPAADRSPVRDKPEPSLPPREEARGASAQDSRVKREAAPRRDPSAGRAQAPAGKEREPEPASAPPRPRKRREEDWDIDISHMSIDEIIAEVQLGGDGSEDAPVREENSLKQAPPREQEPLPRERESGTESRRDRMARDARSFIREMEGSGYAGLKDESAYEKPADSGRINWETGPGREELLFSGAAGTAASRREEEVDPRFRMDGSPEKRLRYGGQEIDLGPEEDYVPPKAQQEAAASRRKAASAEEEKGEEEAVGRGEKILRRLLGSRKKPSRDPSPEPAVQPEESLSPRNEPAAAPQEGAPEEAAPGEQLRELKDRDEDYAPAGDYTAEQVELPPDRGDDFPSFGQYLVGLVSGLLIRARGMGGKAAATVEDDSEELGPEVSPAQGMSYYGSFTRFLRLRLRIGGVLLFFMAWITLGLPVSGALRSIPVASAMLLGLQLCVMLLCLDIVTNAAVNLARPRFGADSLAALCCVLTSLDALAVAVSGFGSPHIPLCLLSSLSLLAVLASSLLSTRALRKTLRVPAIGKRPYSVTGESRLTGEDLTLIKSDRPIKGFVRRAEEMPPDESAFLRAAPALLLLALVLSLITALVKKSFGDLLYILTALLSPAVPLTALLCFALPFFLGSGRIFGSGAAIAGWSGLCDVGRSDNLIVTDRDLFPEGSIRMGTMRILAQSRPEEILTYAGSILAASGIGFSSCFAEQMEKYGCSMKQVENFRFLPGGGMRGIIDRQVILCGGEELMRLMNVRVPSTLMSNTTVLLAVDGILQGIFSLEYEGLSSVRHALLHLMRSSRHPVFAVRDFNVSPAMLHQCFDLATDGYDFPPYVDRFALSEVSPAEDSKVAAVLCREGLHPLVHMADAGRSMFMAVRANLAITLPAAFLGVLLVFGKLVSAGSVSVFFLLLILLACMIPVLLISLFCRR